MLTHTTVTIASTTTSAISGIHGRRVTLKGDRLWRRGSPFPQTCERSIDPLGETPLTAFEQRQARPGRNNVREVCRRLFHAVHPTIHARGGRYDHGPWHRLPKLDRSAPPVFKS